MDIVSKGSVSAATLLWERGSSWVLTVVCKATFSLVPGEAALLPAPEPLLEEEVPWDAPYGRSLRGTCDLVPIKPNVDVILTGHAFAPSSRPVRSLIARLVVGTLDKSIEVLTDRYFDPSGALIQGQPFGRMPLVYERAAGGVGTWNPAGLVIGQRDAHGNVSLPNLLSPGTPALSPHNLAIAPVGFGPIPIDWPSRVEKLGRRSPREIPRRWDGQGVPDDIAREYFNAAPPDQQLSTLREDETIKLENLHVSHPTLVCRLPGVRPMVTLEGRGAPAPITLRVDTLHIDTDRASCTLVWRGHLPIRQPQESDRILVVLEPPKQSGRRATFVGLGQDADPTATIDAPLAGTLNLGPGMMGQALPFPSAPARDQLGQSSSSWNAVASTPARDPLGQSSSSWNTTPSPAPSSPASGRDPLAQSSSSWNSAPVPPRPAAQSSPSWNAITPTPRDPLSQSGSWGTPAPAGSAAPALPAVSSLPAPVPPPRRPIPSSSWEVASPAPASAPPLSSAPNTDSPWGGRGSGPVLDTMGMAAAAAALAAAQPSHDPLPAMAPVIIHASTSLQLLWFDPESVPRIRRVSRWKKHLDELEREPLDRDIEGGEGLKEPWEIEDRREVFEVMARAAPSDARGVEEALAEARRPDGKLVPPLVLMAGDLELPFDELETLRAAATIAASAITPADEDLRAAVDVADKFLGRPGLSATPVVCEGLHLRIREAFGRSKKSLPADYLERQTERVLLTGRHYQKRELLGATFLRALLWVPGEKAALVGYVPEELGKKLPMYRRFGARVIVEVHARQDQYEAQELALRVVVVGRVA